MENRRQQISYLFIVPFLGIFAAGGNLLFGPGAGFQFYLTFVILCLLIVTAGRAVFGRQTWHVKPIDAAWGLFVLYAAVSCFTQGNHSFLKLQNLFIVSGLYGFFRSQARCLLKKRNGIVPVLFALLSLSICVYGFLQYAGVYPSRNSYFDMTSFFINPAPLALFLTVLCPYLALSLFETIQVEEWTLWFTIQKIVIFVSLLSSLIIIVLAWSRTSWVALVVMTAVYFIVFRRRKKIGLLYLMGVAAGLLLLVGGLYFLKPQSANGRLLTYLVSFHVWEHAPLFGVGWHNYSFYYNQFQAAYFQHHPASIFRRLADDMGAYYNEFLRIAVELGITGLILFIGSLFVSFNFSKLKSAPPLVKAAWLSTAGIITAGLFSYPISQPFVLVLFIFNLAVLAHYGDHVLFRVGKLKLKAVAGAVMLAALVLIYHNSVILQASLTWEKAFHTVTEDSEKGLEIYTRLYPKLKAYPAFLYNYGYELSMVGRYSKSLVMLQKARENMYNQDLLLRTGYVQMKLNHYKKAEQSYLQAKYLIPSRLAPRYLLMQLYGKWRKKEKAEKIAVKILSITPKVHSEKALFIQNQTQVYLDSLRHENREESGF